MTANPHSPHNDYHKEYFSSYGIGDPQSTVCLLTVFRVGGGGHDCAAYQAVVPCIDETKHAARWDQLIEDVGSGGNKVSATQAAEMFSLGDLVYRR